MDVKMVEALSAYAHDAWTGWMSYLLSKTESLAGIADYVKPAAAIPHKLVLKWQRQCLTSYADLPEQAKEVIRRHIRRMLEIIQQHTDVAAGVKAAKPSAPSPLGEPHSLEYPLCPRCGSTVVGAMMTSGSIEGPGGESYYHSDVILVYCTSSGCNFDRKVADLKNPPPARCPQVQKPPHEKESGE